ncbi:MAG TPA: transglycosylase SLT domain-containing protein [Thermoanaerobaculia bacterium]|nr:transglycosylase SLT domain-containing protein [Thermoanaerobaculia bacterium]
MAPPPAPVPRALAASEPLPATIEEAKALRLAGKLELYERGLRSLTLSADPATARRAQALLALHLFDRKLYDQALPALTTAAASDPAIAPYLELRIIDADEALGKTSDAIAAASSIVTNAPTSSAATIARLRLPALYAAINDDADMDAALADLAAVPIDALTEGDFVAVASALEKCGKTVRATDIRMRILRDDPGSRFIEPVYAAVKSATPSPLDALTTEEATQLASNLARADRYDQAIDLLQRIAGRADAAASALYRTVRLRALFNSRNYSKLLDETEPATLDAPLQLLRARAAWRDDKPQEFLTGLQRVERQFPKSKEAIEAKVLRAKYYATDVIDYNRSIENLTAAIAAGATGTDGENLWTLGWTYDLANDSDNALRTFDRYVRDYPDGDYKTNALFWTGKIQDRLGHPAERNAAFGQLIAEYPYNYYSYRAREMEPRLQPGLTPAETGAPFPDVDADLAKIADPRLEAVRELLAVDLARDATREMKSVAAAYPDNAGIAFMLADVFSAGGEPLEAISILQRRFRDFVRHGGSNIPHRFWEILYPLNYWDAIRAEAQKRNLDPYLVASIIRQESGFEPTVVSNAGAVGLMQIMPYDASRIGAQAGIDGVTRAQLFDPLTNIALGAAEYSQKLATMSGNHILAIAAYNAGEEAVGRWIAQTSNGDPDTFVDSIPYAETRLYVKSVTRNRFEYRRVYEGSTAVSENGSPSDSRPRR